MKHSTAVRTPSGADSLEQLASKAHRQGDLGYGGDVSPKEAFEFLQHNDGALIDVRTPPEWKQGVPEVANMHLVSWKLAPSYMRNPDFTESVKDLVDDKNTPIFFLCRSGGRSLDAAAEMTRLGYKHCFNVQGGFEAEGGWKAANLPWKNV